MIWYRCDGRWDANDSRIAVSAMYLCRSARARRTQQARNSRRQTQLETLRPRSNVLTLQQINTAAFPITSYKPSNPAPVPNPTTESDNKQLPSVAVAVADQQCAICLEVLQEGDSLRELPCLHYYHQKCIDTWLTTRRGQCPICKRDYAAL